MKPEVTITAAEMARQRSISVVRTYRTARDAYHAKEKEFRESAGMPQSVLVARSFEVDQARRVLERAVEGLNDCMADMIEAWALISLGPPP